MMQIKTMQQSIYELLQKKEMSVDELHHKTDFNIIRISNYIRALYNAKYIKVDINNDIRIYHTNKIKLIKNTGAIAPQFYRGILTDFNSCEEHKIFKFNGSWYNTKNHKNLIPIVEALLKLEKKEVYQKEIYQKAGFLNPTAFSRWLPRLLDSKVLLKTEESYRNSPVFIVDLERVEILLKNLHEFRNFELAFKKLV